MSADRELGLIDEPDAHYPHTWAWNGRCTHGDCDAYEPSEDDSDGSGYWD